MTVTRGIPSSDLHEPILTRHLRVENVFPVEASGAICFSRRQPAERRRNRSTELRARHLLAAVPEWQGAGHLLRSVLEALRSEIQP
jgi:hypothetical protein